jgi:hypothetical protein
MKKIVVPLSIVASVGIAYYYSKNTSISSTELQPIIDNTYYNNYNTHKRAIITESFQYGSYNDKNIINTFSPFSGLVSYYSLYFDQQKLDAKIHDYLYGTYIKYSSTRVFNPKHISDISSILTGFQKIPHKWILVNSKLCPAIFTKYPSQITTSYYDFFNDAINSHAFDTTPEHNMLVIDTRNSDKIWRNGLPENLPEDVKILITDQDNPGHDLKNKFPKHIDELCFVGQYDQMIIKNMQKAFGSNYITTQQPNIENLLDKLVQYKPSLFVKKISQDTTIDMITDTDTYGSVAFISAHAETIIGLPKASGGNYIFVVNESDLFNPTDKKTIHAFIDHLISKNITSIIFTCCHSNTRGPMLSKLFADCVREKKLEFNMFLMFPGIGRISSIKYKKAEYVYPIHLNTMFKPNCSHPQNQ